MMIANNLPSGYFRDLQIIKEVFLPAFQELKDCLQMTTYITVSYTHLQRTDRGASSAYKLV